MMDDVIAEALGRVLALEDSLADVWVYPPEAVFDYPAALVLGSEGVSRRDAYRGGWVAAVSVRLLVLVKPRVELEEAIEAARPWVSTILERLVSHDELQATSEEDPVARLESVDWLVGRVAYAGTDWAAVDFDLSYEKWVHVAVSCDGIGTID